MKELKIVFMGTPDFAVGSLDRLLEAGYEVVGVVTAPDRQAGRGRKLQESAVKRYALGKGLPVLQPENLKDEEFLQALKALGADLQVVVAFRMLPRQVWAMPAKGTFNLHASLLPDYRGAAPINWAIINGEDKTGVTTFFIDDKIDTGAILLQRETPVGKDETAGDLHDRLMGLGAELVVETVKEIEAGKARPQPQQVEGPLKSAPKIHTDTCQIGWDRPVEAVYNHIRGLSPYPAAWTTLYLGNEAIKLKIYAARPEKSGHKLEAGHIYSTKDSMKVAVKGGYIHIEELQLEGKKRLSVKEVLNGLSLPENAYVA